MMPDAYFIVSLRAYDMTIALSIIEAFRRRRQLRRWGAMRVSTMPLQADMS